MSYDVHFLPRGRFPDAESALAASRATPWVSLEDVDREHLEGIATVLAAVLPGFSIQQDHDAVEMTREADGITISLARGEAVLSVTPGPRGADARAVAARCVALARILEERTGLEGFDAQREQRFLEGHPEQAMAQGLHRASGGLGSVDGRVPPASADAHPAFADRGRRGERRVPWLGVLGWAGGAAAFGAGLWVRVTTPDPSDLHAGLLPVWDALDGAADLGGEPLVYGLLGMGAALCAGLAVWPFLRPT